MKRPISSLGIIETRGLVPALEAADTMVKLGKVELSGICLVGGGQVAVVVTGEIGPVQAAIQAGAAAAGRKGEVLSRNVIPRCDRSVVKYLEKLSRRLSPDR